MRTDRDEWENFLVWEAQLSLNTPWLLLPPSSLVPGDAVEECWDDVGSADVTETEIVCQNQPTSSHNIRQTIH